MLDMKRREFITLLGGAAAWPLAAHAQEADRMRHIGVLMSGAIEADQPASVAAFVQTLERLGWAEGRNVRIDIRWARGDHAQARTYAEELMDRTLSWQLPRWPWRRCCKRRATCRSFSTLSLTRSAPATSTPWRARAATRPALLCSTTRWLVNGCSCSSRSHRT